VLRRWTHVVLTLIAIAAAAYGGTRLWPDDAPKRVSTAPIGTARDASTSSSAPSTTAPKPTTTTRVPVTTTTAPRGPAIDEPLTLRKTVNGNIAPKSVVATGTGLVFAQNMMYRHTVTAYDSAGVLVATIPDAVDLAAFGYPGHPGISRGAPVEAAVDPDRRGVYVTNYSMYGAGFGPEGSDECKGPSGLSPSFVYRINIATMKIDAVAQVGMVPKYVAVTPDRRYVLVSNWCSYDLSVVDAATFREVRRVPLGAYPRGIVVDPASRTAFVAVMGSRDIARVDLANFGVGWIRGVGNAPRHLVLDTTGRNLFVTLNGDSRIAKIDTATNAVVSRVQTGTRPRSMAISSDDSALYVVNYDSNTAAKVRTSDLSVVQTVPTPGHPIGITYEPTTHRVFVACYSGAILVFDA
jgi:YVTN family beta-propeller protein